MPQDYIPTAVDKFFILQQNIRKAVVNNAAAWIFLPEKQTIL
jgi:hypothetical protein